MITTLTLNHALKEWSVAVDALVEGKTIVLLRKGGIREERGKFSVDFDRAILYPTYEHQQPDLLKPEYTDLVTPVESGWHPERVSIPGWAEITHIWKISERSTVASLLPYHIWNERFVSERFNWKPKQPLYVLLLRAYRFESVCDIAYRDEYGGCRSWLEIDETLDVDTQHPAIGDTEYQEQVDRIQYLIAESV
ncbi:MAG: DUF1802 family protein [Cyanobacteriota bacterium]|nr:DUF1802 family protein [Cyanobacteriota bacterium]